MDRGCAVEPGKRPACRDSVLDGEEVGSCCLSKSTLSKSWARTTFLGIGSLNLRKVKRLPATDPPGIPSRPFRGLMVNAGIADIWSILPPPLLPEFWRRHRCRN